MRTQCTQCGEAPACSSIYELKPGICQGCKGEVPFRCCNDFSPIRATCGSTCPPSVVSCQVPDRAVSPWIVSTMRLMLFIDEFRRPPESIRPVTRILPLTAAVGYF
jgi:hypothetical protein